MDDLDKYVAERDQREPGFGQLVIDAEKRQAFARELAEQRRSGGKTQTEVAAQMKTSASIVSRLEAGGDVKMSTLEKYVAAIGMQLDFHAIPRARTRSAAKSASTKRSVPTKVPRASNKGASGAPKKKAAG